MLGNGRLEAQCFDGEKRLAHIRGKMRKKVRSSEFRITVISTVRFRCGSIKGISFYSPCENSRMTRRMLLLSTLLTKHGISKHMGNSQKTPKSTKLNNLARKTGNVPSTLAKMTANLTLKSFNLAFPDLKYIINDV